MIVMHKLVDVMKDRRLSMTRLKTDNVVGGGTFTMIANHINKGHSISNITLKTIDCICSYLDCRPADILDYVKDEQNNNT